jgi:Mg-chelatase subunit ChlD
MLNFVQKEARGEVVVARPRSGKATSQVHKEVVKTTHIIQSLHAEGSNSTPERKKLVFGWIQDVSGSMHGDRIAKAIESLRYMFRNVFQPNDFLGVVTYNDIINTVHLPMAVKNVDCDRDVASIQDGFKKGTHNDKCYDALGTSIEALKAISRDPKFRAVTENAVYQLLLITDGGDNASVKYGLSQITALVAQPGLPNFHLTVVAVNMSIRDQNKFQQLCSCQHATFLTAENLDQFKDTMEKVGRNVVARLAITRTVTTTTTTTTLKTASARDRLDALNLRPDRRVLDVTVDFDRMTMGTNRTRPPNPPPCRYFLLNRCNNGSNCKFSHM